MSRGHFGEKRDDRENGGDQYCRFQYMWDATFDAANSKLYVTQTRVPADDRDESIIHVLQIN